jgi:hypothetical protein
MRKESNWSMNICLTQQFKDIFTMWCGRTLFIMCPSDPQNSQTLQKSSIFRPRGYHLINRQGALLLLLSSVLAAACNSPEPVVVSDSGQCGDDGHLTTQLFGALEASLDWQADVLQCGGMPRPAGEGARLRFAGPAQIGSAKRSLAFILAMPGLGRGEIGSELPTNVTMIEEGTGRFFGTQDTGNCWTDIHQNERIGDMDDTNYRVSGILYCVTPLAELNGNANISFAEVRFTGRLNWAMPK